MERRVIPAMDVEKALSESVQELRVSGGTAPASLAKAIIGYMEEGKRPALSCIGTQAIAVGLKSVAIANGELAQQGKLLCVFPSFDKKQFEGPGAQPGEVMTAIKLTTFYLPVVL